MHIHLILIFISSFANIRIVQKKKCRTNSVNKFFEVLTLWIEHNSLSKCLCCKCRNRNVFHWKTLLQNSSCELRYIFHWPSWMYLPFSHLFAKAYPLYIIFLVFLWKLALFFELCAVFILHPWIFVFPGWYNAIVNVPPFAFICKGTLVFHFPSSI